jgi:hypothetical protein
VARSPSIPTVVAVSRTASATDAISFIAWFTTSLPTCESCAA